MVDDWLSIPQLASRAGMVDNTVRRYVQRFPDFFPSRPFDGVTKFPSSCVPLIQRIYSMYQETKSREEIARTLAAEYGRVIEADRPDTMPTPQEATTPTAEPALMERLVSALEALAATSAKVDDLARENVELRARLERLERAHADVLPDQSEKAPPEATKESQPRTLPWWRRLFGGINGE